MPVSTHAKEYDIKAPQWKQVDDCINDLVKAAKTEYLPKPNANDNTADNNTRYNQYVTRAYFMNVVKRTHDGFMGAVYRKNPEIELPPQLEYIEKMASLDGLTLNQFSKDVLSNTMNAGRGAILVDFPLSDGGTMAQTEGLNAYFVSYKAESIINWKAEAGVLTLVVIAETYEKPIDDFQSETKKQYRVLRLIDGVYVQEIWRDEKPYSSYTITDFQGRPLTYIPFTFVGTVNNDTKIDPSLLYSISEINISHYRNSADLEENSFIHGQLTLGISSKMSVDDFEKANPQGVAVGSMAGHFLGEGGSFTSVQANPNSLCANLMKDKQQQMAEIGAQLITQSGGTKSIEQVVIENSSDIASLSNTARNVSAAIVQALEWAGVFMGVSESETPVFELNQEFYDSTVTPQEVIAAIQLYDRGRMAEKDLHTLLQKAKYISENRTLEDVNNEASEQNPLI